MLVQWLALCVCYVATASFCEESVVTPQPVGTPASVAPPCANNCRICLKNCAFKPRAGEISNGVVSGSIVDVFATDVGTKAKAAEIKDEYEKALLEQAMKWGAELNEVRARYEAKLIGALPDEKRAAAQKLLDTSRIKWADALARDAATRNAYMERMRSASLPSPEKTAIGNGIAGKPPVGPTNPNSASAIWLRDERMKAAKQDDDTVKEMRAVLMADDAARFDRLSHPRVTSNITPVPKAPATFAPAAAVPVLEKVPAVPSTGLAPAVPPAKNTK